MGGDGAVRDRLSQLLAAEGAAEGLVVPVLLGLVHVDLRELDHLLQLLGLGGGTRHIAQREAQRELSVFVHVVVQMRPAGGDPLHTGGEGDVRHDAEDLVSAEAIGVVGPKGLLQGGREGAENQIRHIVAVEIAVQTEAVHVAQQHRQRLAQIALRPAGQIVAAQTARLPVVVQQVLRPVEIAQRAEPCPQHHIGDDGRGEEKLQHVDPVDDEQLRALCHAAQPEEQGAPQGVDQRQAQRAVEDEHRHRHQEHQKGGRLPPGIPHGAEQDDDQHGGGLRQIQPQRRVLRVLRQDMAVEHKQQRAVDGQPPHARQDARADDEVLRDGVGDAQRETQRGQQSDGQTVFPVDLLAAVVKLRGK